MFVRLLPVRQSLVLLSSASLSTVLQVIDSFTVTADSFASHPATAHLCAGREGIVAIPDPGQACPTDFPAGVPMRLHRPDGTTALLTLAAVLCPHRTVGLFFAAPTVTDIPRLSQLEALASSSDPA